MSFEVKIVNRKVKVTLPRDLEGTEVVRLDMSDGSFALLRVKRDSISQPVFEINLGHMSPALRKQLERNVGTVIHKMAKRRSPEPATIKISKGKTYTIIIGNRLSGKFNLTVTQAGHTFHVEDRQIHSDPVTISNVTAVQMKLTKKRIKKPKD